MLKKIYRAIVLAQTASAAVKVVERMTDAQLLDVGIIRGQFPVEAMKVVESRPKCSAAIWNLDIIDSKGFSLSFIGAGSM